MLAGLVVIELFGLKGGKIMGDAMVSRSHISPMYILPNDNVDLTITLKMRKMSQYSKELLYRELQLLTTNVYTAYQDYGDHTFLLKPFDLLDIVDDKTNEYVTVVLRGVGNSKIRHIM